MISFLIDFTALSLCVIAILLASVANKGYQNDVLHGNVPSALEAKYIRAIVWAAWFIGLGIHLMVVLL